ncbi:hypothetical protein CASFOL_020924 [Castilleja foliolosa]|uniref:Uncharacterized protein n=1 Tax=Castilleja foliolosa TaxID=1961234 RepID=A0ABD3D6M7_9LAMI
MGSAAYAPEKDSLVWKIKSFPGGKEYMLRAEFRLPSVTSEEPTPERKAPIRVKFEIPYFTVSGIQVRYLKIIEKSGYQALPWESQNGNWWLEVNKVKVGYCLWRFFTKLQNGGATRVELGGTITNNGPITKNTTTQMGSGHSPKERYGKAAYFQAIQVYSSMNDSWNREHPTILTNFKSVKDNNKKCHGLEVGKKFKCLGNYSLRFILRSRLF